MSGWVQSLLLEAPVPLHFPAHTQAGSQHSAKGFEADLLPCSCSELPQAAHHWAQIRALQPL